VLAAALSAVGPAAAGTTAAPASAPLATSAAERTHLPHYDDYLALGDSLAAGVQPNASGQDVITGQGYAQDLAVALKQRDRRLDFVDLACPGETSRTMLYGGCPYPYPYTDQTDAAASFLAAHQSDRILVTLDIGANDIDGCSITTASQAACFGTGMLAVRQYVPQILARLKAAAGPRVQFVAMNYYDPFLAVWLRGGENQSLALATTYLDATFSGILSTAYSAYGVPVADVESAFDTADSTTLVDYLGQQMPLDVARLCEWTWACTAAPVGPDIHANAVGYQHIEQAFAEVIGH
jgi:lysophospholipase L1-like esterase